MFEIRKQINEQFSIIYLLVSDQCKSIIYDYYNFILLIINIIYILYMYILILYI